MPAKLPHSRPAVPPAMLLVRIFGVLALTALLGACGETNDKFPPACPSLALVPDAADMTRFDGRGIDVTNMIVRGRITAVPASCETAKTDTVRAILHVEADVARGPASPPDPPPLPYFIALLQGDHILQEQDFVLAPVFGANVNSTTMHGDDIELLLPVSKKMTAAAYRIFVGFRLSPEQLAYNRAHARP